MSQQTEKMKAMVSQPMNGLSDEEIVSTRNRIKNILERHGFEFVNTMFTDEWYKPENMEERGVVNIPLCFLAKSLENMSKCHVAVFALGWQEKRGCRIEKSAAEAYQMNIFYETKEGTLIGDIDGQRITLA